MRARALLLLLLLSSLLLQGHCFADTEFGGKRRLPAYKNVPAAVFSDPSVGAVGLTQEEAVAQYRDVTIFKTSFRPMLNTLTAPPPAAELVEAGRAVLLRDDDAEDARRCVVVVTVVVTLTVFIVGVVNGEGTSLPVIV